MQQKLTFLKKKKILFHDPAGFWLQEENEIPCAG